MPTSTAAQKLELPSAHDMTKALMHDAYPRHFVLPNYYPPRWFECDVFSITRASYMREYEVKTSRADYRADFLKGTRPLGRKVMPAERVGLRKHTRLSEGDEYGPVQFWFVTPEGLIEPSEVPEYAGLIYMQSSSWGYPVMRRVKKAPRLHNKPLSMVRMIHARSVAHHRYIRSLLYG